MRRIVCKIFGHKYRTENCARCGRKARLFAKLKHCTIYVVVVLILVSVVHAQAGEQPRNGTWWLKQSRTTKETYLQGAMDHASQGNLSFESRKMLTASVGTVRVKLDYFYTIPINRNAQVAGVLPMILVWIAAGPGATLEQTMQRVAETAQSESP